MKNKILIILIVTLFLIGSLGLYYFYYRNEQEPQFKEVAFVDYTVEYPATPEALMEENNYLMELLYSGQLSDDDFALALEKQRVLFSNQLLRANTLEKYVSYMREDVDKFKNAKIKLHDIKTNAIVKDKFSDKIYIAEVQQIFDENYINNVKYYIAEENGVYSILAWEYTGTNGSGS